MIATNCDRLEVYLAGRHLATGVPDTRRFGALAHPPVFVDLTVDGADRPELRIDGYLGGRWWPGPGCRPTRPGTGWR